MKQWHLGNDKGTDFSTNRKRYCDDAVIDVIAMALAFSVENLINFVQNEHVLWDLHADTCEEDKELPWHRIASDFGFLTGKQLH